MLSRLASEDDPRCLPALMAATADPAAEVRAAAVRAVEAVARPGNRAAVQALMRRLEDLHETSVDVRNAAFAALSALQVAVYDVM